jgi:hypothetical protein
VVKVYFDATSSMKGFVGPKAGTTFIGFVQKLEEVFSFAWRSNSTECYKFGSSISRLSGNRCYMLPTQPGFYNLTGHDDITQIDKAIEQVGAAPSLSIIITDLYQNDADLGTLFQAFKRHVFSKNLSVGIAAMRSGFSGTIYDIGLGTASRNWQRERPFYAIVIGGKSDVVKYFQELSRPPATVPTEQLVILSPDLLESLLAWSNSPRAEPRGIAEDPTLFTIAQSQYPFGIVRLQRSDEICSVKLRMERSASPFHPSLDWTKAGTQVSLFLERDGKAIPVSDAQAVTASIGFSAGNNPLPRMQVQWDPRRLIRGKVYIADIRPVADATLFRFPAFVSDWSVPVSHPVDPFDGSKTQNLREFVMGLWRSMFEHHHPELGAYYIYVRK